MKQVFYVVCAVNTTFIVMTDVFVKIRTKKMTLVVLRRLKKRKESVMQVYVGLAIEMVLRIYRYITPDISLQNWIALRKNTKMHILKLLLVKACYNCIYI